MKNSFWSKQNKDIKISKIHTIINYYSHRIKYVLKEVLCFNFINILVLLLTCKILLNIYLTNQKVFHIKLK